MSSLRRKQLAMAGRKAKEKARLGRVVNPGRTSPVVQTDPDPLGKVKFASSAAEQFAEDNSLTWRNFAESLIQPSSDNGYTKFDVRRVLKEMSQDEEEE